MVKRSKKPQSQPVSRSKQKAGAAGPKVRDEHSAELHQERYRMLIEDVADAFYEVDLHGNFTFFNNALVRVFGYTRRELQGHNYREFMDEANAAVAYQTFNKIHRTRRSLVGIPRATVSSSSFRPSTPMISSIARS